MMILNKRRFLSNYGLDHVNNLNHGDPSSLKVQVIGLLQAVQYLKVPVIAFNTITILFELIFGGS
jgi:immediate early response 3-interacting protein 1